MDEINPRPDTPDYYGNLPLFYSLKLDDLPMLEKQFQKGKEYFTLRNYRYETVFHVAGRYNALKSIKFVKARLQRRHSLAPSCQSWKLRNA